MPCPCTADIQQKRGINILPVAGGSHFAVRSPAYCLDFMRETAADFGGSRKVSEAPFQRAGSAGNACSNAAAVKFPRCRSLSLASNTCESAPPGPASSPCLPLA